MAEAKLNKTDCECKRAKSNFRFYVLCGTGEIEASPHNKKRCNHSIATMLLTTFTLFHYPAPHQLWAFAQMAFAIPALKRTSGLRFWKLLGSGQGSGFSLHPNWSRYALLAVWENAETARAFFAKSAFMQKYRRHADEIWTVHLLPLQAHGAWSGVNPFLPVIAQKTGGPIAVLTRANIRWRCLAAFWSEVPATSRVLENAAGRLASIGIGEAPFVRQATFSLWRSAADLQAFAYHTVEHQKAMRRTRAEGWYREELFARFMPVASEGTWDGRNPLS